MSEQFHSHTFEIDTPAAPDGESVDFEKLFDVEHSENMRKQRLMGAMTLFASEIYATPAQRQQSDWVTNRAEELDDEFEIASNNRHILTETNKDGEVVAAADVTFHEGRAFRSARLENLAVAESERGHHLGEKLLQRVEEVARENKAYTVELIAASDAKKGITSLAQWYANYGYEATGVYVDEIHPHMRKILPPTE